MRFECAGGSSFIVFASRGKASGDHDQCGWVVDDFEAEVAELRRRGITFEEFEGYTFAGGIRQDPTGRSVWFRDSEDNLLNIRENAPGAAKLVDAALSRRDRAQPGLGGRRGEGDASAEVTGMSGSASTGNSGPQPRQRWASSRLPPTMTVSRMESRGLGGE